MAPHTSYPPSPVAPATGKKIYPSKKVAAGLIFLTAVTYKRIPVFREPTLCQLFLCELHFYRAQYAFRLHGYVLLPDHFHLLLSFPPEKRFADFLRDFKSAVARSVIDWAKETNRTSLLTTLTLPGRPKRRRDARYSVLQANSYVRLVTSASMFRQKLDYIHLNPVRARLVERAVDYPYSSLRNYERGVGPISLDPHNLLLS